jgi:predicted metal-dependent hydrolase
VQVLTLGNIEIEVTQKDIKNVHLSVHPPLGAVRVAAPLHLDLDSIRIYAISKMGWIRRQQEKLKKQKREAPRLYIDRESHYVFGKRYMLKIKPTTGKYQILLKPRTIEMHVHPETTFESKKALLDEWRRNELKAITATLVQKWEKTLSVSANAFGVRKMTTKWGSCNEQTKRIWFNLELSKKPIEFIEYVVAHELVHLKERKHNDKFIGYLNKHLPNWRHLKEQLNKLPI